MVRRAQRSSRIQEEEAAATGLNDRTVGLLWLAGGAAVTFLTYAVAAPGGVYVVAWGAMLVGAVKLLGSLSDTHDADGEPLSYRDRITLGQEMALRAMYFIAREAGGVSGVREQAINTVLWRMTETEFPADRRRCLPSQKLRVMHSLMR
jgi:hypothetical protein